jgi:Uma2 family endonuclease
VSIARALVTEAEFLSLPESMQRMELIDGEVHVPPSPTFWHQETLSRIITALRNWAGTQPAPVTVCQAPMDVRFAPGRILQPDGFVLLSAVPPGHEGPIEDVPALCVEVLSTNRAFDRVTKRYIYAEAGVRELWTVEPSGFVERWSGDGLSQSESIRDVLRSPLLPGFELALAKLWPVR